MNINDRIALEIGRSLFRMHVAEAMLEEERVKTADLAEQLAKVAPEVKESDEVA